MRCGCCERVDGRLIFLTVCPRFKRERGSNRQIPKMNAYLDKAEMVSDGYLDARMETVIQRGKRDDKENRRCLPGHERSTQLYYRPDPSMPRLKCIWSQHCTIQNLPESFPASRLAQNRVRSDLLIGTDLPFPMSPKPSRLFWTAFCYTDQRLPVPRSGYIRVIPSAGLNPPDREIAKVRRASSNSNNGMKYCIGPAGTVQRHPRCNI